MSSWYSESDFELHKKLLSDMVQKQKKPLTIAVIGLPGCGKSSFINTAMAVFSGEYHERAMVGDFGEDGKHVTRRLTSYTKEKYLTKETEVKFNYPTFLDMMGFQNDNDDDIGDILKLVFNERPRDHAILNVEAKQQTNLIDRIYHGDSIEKVDRIIFVASSESKQCPTELIKAVLCQTMERKRDIPVFGVLTHADKIDEDDNDFTDFENKYKKTLGLTGLRYMRCSNYCDDIPWGDARNFNVEVPMIRFFQQVMDPTREVYEEKQNITEKLNVDLKTILIVLAVLVVLLLLLFK